MKETPGYDACPGKLSAKKPASYHARYLISAYASIMPNA